MAFSQLLDLWTQVELFLPLEYCHLQQWHAMEIINQWLMSFPPKWSLLIMVTCLARALPSLRPRYLLSANRCFQSTTWQISPVATSRKKILFHRVHTWNISEMGTDEYRRFTPSLSYLYINEMVISEHKVS